MNTKIPYGTPLLFNWYLSHRADPRARVLADKHYNRQKVGAPQFAPPGRCIVLLADGPDGNPGALWITSWPFAQYVKHRWAGAWVCSCFRKENHPWLASDLVREAVAVTRWLYGPPPEQGFITFVNRDCVRPKRDPGRCYRKAGWSPAGETAGGLVALQLAAGDVPDMSGQPVVESFSKGSLTLARR